MAKICKKCNTEYEDYAEYCNICHIDLIEDAKNSLNQSNSSKKKVAISKKLSNDSKEKDPYDFSKAMGYLVVLGVSVFFRFFTDGLELEGVLGGFGFLILALYLSSVRINDPKNLIIVIGGCIIFFELIEIVGYLLLIRIPKFSILFSIVFEEMGITIYSYYTFPVIVVILASILMIWKSRIAAILLFVVFLISTVNTVRYFGYIENLAIIMLCINLMLIILTFRPIQATFKLKKKLKT